MYRCTHSRHPILSDCYLNSCILCNVDKKEKCDYDSSNNSDKLYEMFHDTEFRKLLELPRTGKESGLLDRMDIF